MKRTTGALFLAGILLTCYACKKETAISVQEPVVNTGVEQEHVWFQNFEEGTGFSAGNSGSATEAYSNVTGEQNRCVMLDVHNPGEPGNDLNRINIQSQSGKPVDVRGYDYLTFFLKNKGGESTHTVTLVDSSGAEWFGWVDILSDSEDWKKAMLPLDMATNIDLSSIQEVRIGEWGKGVFYIDDVYFTKSEFMLTPSEKKLLFTFK